MTRWGTGEQQILALAFAYAYAEAFHGGIVLVVEEPEAHLHPLAQEWLAKRLTAMASGGLQIIMTTHSPSYIEILNLEGLVLVTKAEDGTKIKQVTREQFVEQCLALGSPPARTTLANILPFYSANATRDLLSGFFAKVVVLVEGPTEALALPIYFAKCGLHAAREGVAVIPVHGKGNFAKWRRLFVTYDVPCYVVFDNDASDDETASKRRDALTAVGVDDDAHEGYIESEDWIVENRFAVFGTDFETMLRARFPTYDALETAARNAGIDTKPFVARRVAEALPRDDGSQGWTEMQAVTDAVRALLAPPAVDW